MKRTSLLALTGTFVFLALATLILTWRFYSIMPPVGIAGAFTVWFLIVVVIVLIIMVRRNLREDNIGLDSSQLDPLTVARFLVVGKASAWTGAIIGGLYTGAALYVVPQAGMLIAAEQDMNAVLLSSVGGVVLAGVGVILERCCETPPTDSQSHA